MWREQCLRRRRVENIASSEKEKTFVLWGGGKKEAELIRVSLKGAHSLSPGIPFTTDKVLCID